MENQCQTSVVWEEALRQDSELQLATHFITLRNYSYQTQVHASMNVSVHCVRDPVLHMPHKPSWKSSNILLWVNIQRYFTLALANRRNLGKPRVKHAPAPNHKDWKKTTKQTHPLQKKTLHILRKESGDNTFPILFLQKRSLKWRDANS